MTRSAPGPWLRAALTAAALLGAVAPLAAQVGGARAPAAGTEADPFRVDPPHAARVPTAINFVETDAVEAGMSREGLSRVDSLLVAAVAAGVTPGAAVAIGRHGRLVRLRGYGWLDWDRERLATPATLYDLASLTKVVGTTTAVMRLDQEGRLDLDRPVVDLLPWWSGDDPRKETVTVRQLLLHRAGLPAFRPWYLERSGDAAYRRAVAATHLEFAPGTRTLYSDLGAMTLGWVVEAVVGLPLDAFLEDSVFVPLGMEETVFRPSPALLPRIAPTEVDTLWRRTHVRGRVHDENAEAMGGVAGHAGLFSTVWDLSIFAQTMLDGGVAAPCEPRTESGIACTRPRPDSVRLVDPEVLRRYTRRFDRSSSRTLGWEVPEGRSSAGDFFTATAYGHTGFTGTSIWIDPELDLFVVLLTNRVDPTRAQSGHVGLRRAVHDAAALAVTDRPVERRPGD